MDRKRTSRWKHTDTQADLRAFLGDAAGMFSPGALPAEREQQIDQLSDHYGLSQALANKAISALQLAHGDSRAAYELLTQWSLPDSQILPQLIAPGDGEQDVRRDNQLTDLAEFALERNTWSEVEANYAPPPDPAATVEDHKSRQFARYVTACLQAYASRHDGSGSLADRDFQQQLVTAAVREFGLKPETARQTVAELLPHAVSAPELEQQIAKPYSSISLSDAASSPDTLPDLESIMQEEADWLDRERAAAKAPTHAAPQNQSQRDAFREYVEQRLNNITGNLLDARQWKKLRDHGTSQFGLPGADAGHLIEERAHRRRMRVLTPQRAVEQFTALVGGYYHRHGRITSAAKSRFVAAANRLGLDAAEARRLLDSPPPLETFPQTSGQPRYRLLLGLSGAAACAMIAFFLWVAYSQGPPGANLADRGSSNSAAPKASQAAANRFEAPPWWDPQTIAAAQAISGDDPAFDRILAGLSHPHAEARRDSVLRFLDGLDCDTGAFENNRDQYRQVLVGYLALEPEQLSAVEAFAHIAGSLNEFSAHWPTTPGLHKSLFWRLEVLLSAIDSPQTSRGRADAFAAVLTEAVQITLNAADVLAWRNACSMALAERCYRVLMNSADRTPHAILEAQASLAAAARPFVPQVHLDRFESKLLCSLLLDGRQWHDFRDLVRHQVGSSDVHNVLRFVAAYEQMPASETRDQLGVLLLSRAGLRRENRTFEQTARVVRAALDRGEQGDRFIDRWERFTFDSERLLMQVKIPQDEAELAQTALAVAHQNLLGAALAFHDGHGKLAFDQFAVEGPPQLDRKGPGSPASIFPVHPIAPPHLEMTRDSAEGLLYRAQLLNNLLPNTDQLYHWEIAVRIVQRWQEIPPPVASLLARFILSPLDERTERVVLNDSRLLLSLHAFQLALADAIETSPLNDEALAARLSKLLNKQVTFDENSSRREYRQLMLESVYRQLSRSTVSTVPATALPDLRDHLTRIYQAKARLLNVSPGAYLTAHNPADMLAAIVDQEIESSLDDEQGHMEHAALAASRFRAQSELEEAVLIQRQWVQQLARKVSARRHVDHSQVADLVEQWQLRTHEADSLLAQLYWSEVAELRLWLICNDTN